MELATKHGRAFVTKAAKVKDDPRC